MTRGSGIATLFPLVMGTPFASSFSGGTDINEQTATFATSASPLPPAVSVDESPSPPPRGLPLGALLGVTISVLVALLLGGLTALQLHRDERRELAVLEGVLAESLAPLAGQIEEARSLSEIAQRLSSQRLAEISSGRPDYNLVLRDADGRVLASADSTGYVSPPEDSLHTSITVRPKALSFSAATLMVWQETARLSSEMALRRHEALFDIGITVLAVIFVVQLAIYFLVSRPLNRLLTAIDKFEQGYPAGFRAGSVTRELSWLELRLHRMSVGLTNSARLLVAAHRKATETSKARHEEALDPLLFDPLTIDEIVPAAGDEIVRRYLRDRCALLEGCNPGDPTVRDIALEVWSHDAAEAERLGEMDLRTRLENSALKLLDPVAFDRVSRELDSMVTARAAWCQATSKAITSALAADKIPQVKIQHRAKHAAGAWRKMHEKHLAIDEVHDLLAFRIIVPGTDDCYLALETVHRLFEPEPFRFKDYIANPKSGGYQSLHTSVRDSDEFTFELQIRSIDMHRAAEGGEAAHWRYHADKSRLSAMRKIAIGIPRIGGVSHS